MDTLLGFKAEGKIGGIGFSEISPASLRRACAVGPVDAVQSEYSLWSRSPELGMLQACAELDVAFVPFSPVGRGIFAQETPDPATFRDTDFRKDTPRFTEPNFGYNVAKINAFKALAQDLGTHPTSLAIAWCLQRGPHLIPIPGTRSSAHLTQCADASKFMMSAEIMTQIETILPVAGRMAIAIPKPNGTGRKAIVNRLAEPDPTLTPGPLKASWPKDRLRL